MAMTYKAIASTTVGSGGASTIEFTSIPSSYTDLLIKVSGRTTQASLADNVYVTFNGSTSNFSSRVMYTDGSATLQQFTAARYAGSQPGSTAGSNIFSNIDIYIPNYNSNINKSYMADAASENNGTTGYVYLASALWADTSSINSIVLTPNAGSFVQYSTATIYGIKKS